MGVARRFFSLILAISLFLFIVQLSLLKPASVVFLPTKEGFQRAYIIPEEQPLRAYSERLESSFHCCGSNFLPESSWVYQSCLFENLCWDQSQLVVAATDHLRFTNLTSYQVSLAAQKTGQSIKQQKHAWFPKILPRFSVPEPPVDPVIWIPLSIPGGRRQGDPIGDWLFPVYNLLCMFGFVDDSHQHPTVYFIPVGDNSPPLSQDVESALSLVGTVQSLSSNQTTHCARYGLAGIGMLNLQQQYNHFRGTKLSDYQHMKHMGKGWLWRRFEQFLSHRMPATAATNSSGVTVLVDEQIENDVALPTNLPDSLHVESIALQRLPFLEQVQALRRANVYVTHADRTKLVPMLMNPGSTLFLLYDENETVEDHHPIHRDFDVWNNLVHIRVFWLSLQSDLSTGIRKHLLPPASSATTSQEGQATPKHRCIGDNLLPNSWMYRSCQYTDLCFDSQTKQFTMLGNTTLAQSKDVSLGTAAAWMAVTHPEKLEKRNRWSPAIMDASSDSQRLSDDTVVVPFVAETANVYNPGHALWDHWLPIFTLLSLFELESRKLVLVVMNKCDESCQQGLRRFLPLLTPDSNALIFRSSHNESFCAPHAAAGMAMLTDHGNKHHGQKMFDYRNVHNLGRGPAFWAFREYMLQQMGIDETKVDSSSEMIVTFSTNSSKQPARQRDFALHRATVEDIAKVEALELSSLSLPDQIRLALRTWIYVSVIGGSTITACFLPRGAVLILFFDDHAKVRSDLSVMMDWDFWNQASYLKVHWFPLSTMDDDIAIFRSLVRSEARHYKRLHS